MSKKIAILGGGLNQMPLIKRAKELGYIVVLCDFRDNVPGIAYADKHYQVDTLNPEQVIIALKKENVDGIATNSEPAFISAKKIADALSLRSIGLKEVLLYKNKYLMRQFCVEQGIKSPLFRKCATIEDALSFFQSVNKKCIIKPLDNSASRGVYSINTIDDIIKYFDMTLESSSKENPYVLIEEYIEGTEFTIDGIKVGNNHYCLAISEKKHYEYNENVANQLLFSEVNESFDYNRLRAINDSLVCQTGLTFGLTHAEYKYSNGEYYLIEIQNRGGGNFIATDIVPFISGIDSYTCLLKWSVGEEVDFDYNYSNLSSRCAVLHFFDIPSCSGKVEQIQGEEFLTSFGNNIMYDLNFKVGDYITKADNDASRIGYYILKSQSLEELKAGMDSIHSNFNIIIES